MTFTKEQIKQQEEFVKAISYQKEVAINAFYDAAEYKDKISEKYAIESFKLEHMKDLA